MSHPNKIAAIAAAIAGIAFFLAVPASAQNAPASTSPRNTPDLSAPKSEASPKKVNAVRHSWSKKHASETKTGKKPKPKTTHQPS
jgi:hypothetical protein